MLRRFYAFWIFPSVTLLLFYGYWPRVVQRPQLLLPWFLTGLIIWTVLEYLIHRYLFHGGDSLLGSLRRKTHLRHHGHPRDPNRIFLKGWFTLPVSFLCWLLLHYTLEPAGTTGLLAGLWSGFLYYESVHYRMHVSKSNGSVLQWQRRSHFHHHFVDSNRCYGVTSPIWDRVFGTARR